MKLSLLVALLLVAASFAFYGQTAAPRITSVDPLNGKIGDVITAGGENLGKANIAKLYLTDGGDGKNDLEVQITEQTDTTIKFKIPAKATGRLALLIRTNTHPPQDIEQPVKLTIDDKTVQ